MFYLRFPGRAAHARKEDPFPASVLEEHARRYQAFSPQMTHR
jgi:hypothetical protein